MKHVIRMLSVALIALLLTALFVPAASALNARHTMEVTPTPTEEATPSSEAEETPSPTPEETPTPTPEEETPTPVEDEETPTPTHGNTSTTAPTKKPSIYTEPTRDPYDPSTRVTNPPPTMAPDVELPGEIVTPVPEEKTPAPVGGGWISNDPSAGLLILFGVLILLLALDIAAILWRKNLGFSGLLNGGVAVRNVEQSMESDEQTVEDDTP